MKNKIIHFFMHNTLLKILALLLGVLLWLILTNMQDPSITRTLSVPITYDDTWLTENGYTVTSAPTSVSLSVTLRRSNVTRLSASDFTANVNLQEFLGGEINPAPEITRFNLVVTKNASATYIESWDFQRNQGSYVDAVIDTMKTNSYRVQFRMTGDAPDGYTAVNFSADPAVVTVTGPTSEFATLSSVQAAVDLSQIQTDSSDWSQECALMLCDGNDRQITSSNLVLSQDAVTVSMNLNQTKEVGVSIPGYTGEPAQGYGCSKFDYSPKTVKITGTTAALATVSSITIPQTVLDISGVTENTTLTVSVADYLPSNVALADGESGQISVVFAIGQLSQQTFSIDSSLFTLTGMNDAYDYQIVSDTVDVTLSAFQEELDSFSEDSASISGTVNVSGLSPSPDPQRVSVLISVASQYSLADEVSVEVLVTEKTQESTTGQPQTTASETAEPVSEGQESE